MCVEIGGYKKEREERESVIKRVLFTKERGREREKNYRKTCIGIILWVRMIMRKRKEEESA